MEEETPETCGHLKGKRLDGYRDENRQVSVPEERKESENKTGSGSQGENSGPWGGGGVGGAL